VANGTTIINPSGGCSYSNNTLYDLIQKVVEHIFFDKVFPAKAFDSALKELGDSELTVSVFGPSKAESFLKQSLKMSTLENATIQTSENAHATDVPEAIAIVGKSGRFPGSDTLQGFWDILVQNKDMHRKAS
jgi:hypothetical protein